MATYDDLKVELLDIAKVIEKFPVEVRPKVYDLLVSRFLGESVSVSPGQWSGVAPETANKVSASTKPKPVKSASNKSSSKESYSIDKDLNLRGDNKNIPSFREFFQKKKPGSAAAFNAVAVYYLKKLLELPIVTLNHAYTCYAEVKKKPAEHFKQSFIDAKNKFGYVDFDSSGNLEIPHRGVVFVDHDLPVKEKDKK